MCKGFFAYVQLGRGQMSSLFFATNFLLEGESLSAWSHWNLEIYNIWIYETITIFPQNFRQIFGEM